MWKTPEERIADLEALCSDLVDMLQTALARGLALQQLLSERGLVEFDQVTARMQQMQDSANTEVCCAT